MKRIALCMIVAMGLMSCGGGSDSETKKENPYYVKIKPDIVQTDGAIIIENRDTFPYDACIVSINDGDYRSSAFGVEAGEKHVILNDKLNSKEGYHYPPELIAVKQLELFCRDVNGKKAVVELQL